MPELQFCQIFLLLCPEVSVECRIFQTSWQNFEECFCKFISIAYGWTPSWISKRSYGNIVTFHRKFFTPLHKFGQKIGIKNICQKCQDSIMCWFTELIPDTFGWFLGFRKVRKSAGIYIVKHRFRHRKTLVYSGYLIGLWPLGEATSSVGRLILSKPKNQAKESGFDVVNQKVSSSWFIWFIFCELAKFWPISL